MKLSREKFEELEAEAIDDLPPRFREKINNLVFFVEDFPTPEQLGKTGGRDRYGLLGLFEGYAQSRRLNFGPVLPDRISIFRQPILAACQDESECRERIGRVVRHEIAHHFGLGEAGARRAERRK